MTKSGIIEFSYFGKLEARTSDGHIIKFSNRKILSLISYLGADPSALHDRQALGLKIWPDSDPLLAISSLRNALSVLRRDLKAVEIDLDRVLEITKTSVKVLSDQIWTDLGWVTQVDDPVLRLETLAFEVAPGYDFEWLEPLRIKAESHGMQCLETILKSNNPDRLQHAMRFLEANPTHELRCKIFMDSCLKSGNPQEAIVAYKKTQKALRNKLGMSPSQVLVELAKSAKQQVEECLPLLPSNLKRPQNKTLGRATELELILTLLSPETSRSQIITLLGPGGIGKTQVALECGCKIRDEYQDRAWFIDLSTTTKTEAIPKLICEVIAGDTDDCDPIESIARAVGQRPWLVVLDNLEQIEIGLGSVLASLAQSFPNLKILGTSRKSHMVSGEVTVRLGALNRETGIELFLDRACAFVQKINLENDKNALESLVECLEGVPLALCLAASRADMLTPQQMVKQLQVRAEVLKLEQPDFVPRHRSLWHCIDWSIQLVPECWDCLKILASTRGGWTLAMAEWMTEDAQIMSKLQTLLRSNLIFESWRGDAIRFDMFESIREYLRAVSTKEECENAEKRLAKAVDNWFDCSQAKGQNYNKSYVLERSQEYENFRKAFEWAIVHDSRLALKIANGLTYFWWSIEANREGKAWLERAIQATEDRPDEDLAMAYRGLATLYLGLSDYKGSQESLERCLSLLPQDCKPNLRIRVMNSAGNILTRLGRFEESQSIFYEAIELGTRTGEQALRMTATSNVGFCHLLAGELDKAESLIARAIEESQTSENIDWVAYYYHNFGLVAKARGDYEEARNRLDHARGILEGIGVNPAVRSWLTDAAYVAVKLGLYEEGLSFLKESAKAVAQIKGEEQMAEVVEVASIYWEQQGNYEEALALLEVLERTQIFPQRSIGDVSPNISTRRESLLQKVSASRRRVVLARYKSLSLRNMMDEMEDIVT